MRKTQQHRKRRAENIRKLTMQLMQEVKNDANMYGGPFIYRFSPYGSLHPQEVLRFPGVRSMLNNGIYDDSGRRWILLNFDGGTKPYLMKFRPVISFRERVTMSFKRITHPLRRPVSS